MHVVLVERERENHVKEVGRYLCSCMSCMCLSSMPMVKAVDQPTGAAAAVRAAGARAAAAVTVVSRAAEEEEKIEGLKGIAPMLSNACAFALQQTVQPSASSSLLRSYHKDGENLQPPHVQDIAVAIAATASSY